MSQLNLKSILRNDKTYPVAVTSAVLVEKNCKVVTVVFYAV